MKKKINDMNKITDNIYLGNFVAARNVRNLKNEGIKKVLYVMQCPLMTYNKEDDINQEIIKIVDVPSENIIKYFGKCLKFIEGDDKILVHCMEGVSRSATIVIAYIMWKEKKSMNDAIKFVRSKRPIISPNYGFKKQLKMFENILKEKNYNFDNINFNNIKWKYIQKK